MFTVPATGCVLYVFVVLHHARWQIVHINAAAHLIAELTAPQLRDAFPFFDPTPRFIIAIGVLPTPRHPA